MKAITPALKRLLKKPLGTLYKGGAAGKARLKAALSGRFVVAVGDATVQSLFKLGVHPHVRVFDLKTRREALSAKDQAWFSTLHGQRLTAVNPAGHVTPSLEKAVHAALASPVPANVFVIGEEDLAVLPALLHAPLGATICYGQPKVGLVVVDVTPENKAKAHQLLGKFKTVRV